MAVTPPDRGSPSGIGSLVRTIVVLALAVLAFAGVTRACSFSPTSPEVDRSSLPRVDAAAALRDARASTPFPLRTPLLPPDWIAQSSDVARVAGTRVARVGWVTPDDAFLRLVQSDAPEQALVASEQGDPAARGAAVAGGRTWVVHTGVRDEAVWVTDVDGVRLLVTGDASPERFTELATAVLAAPPV